MLVVIALIAVVSDAVSILGGFVNPVALMALAGVFGATVFALYPVIVAHANDHAAPGSFIQVSGGLLLVYGVGSIVGPTIAGLAMSRYGEPSLFAIIGLAHVLLTLFALVRLKSAPAVASKKKGSFQSTPMARVSTPETAALAADEAELRSDRAQQIPSTRQDAAKDNTQ